MTAARRAGLALVAAGAAAVVASTFLPWIEVDEFRIHLWDLAALEPVVLATCAFVAFAFAALGLLRGGRELPVTVAGALLAGVALAVVRDVRAGPHVWLGSGDKVAAAGAVAVIAGAVLLIVTAGGRHARLVRLVLAAVAVTIGFVVGNSALDLHPEIQIVR